MIKLTEWGTNRALFIDERTITLVKHEDAMWERSESGDFGYVPCNRTRIGRGERENVYVTETPEEVLSRPLVTWPESLPGE